MRIEWLNDEMTEAIVTRGWFWKRCAHVKRGDVRVTDEYSSYNVERWVFAATGRYVGWWTNERLDSAKSSEQGRRKREADDAAGIGREWQPVRALPRAEVKRG